MHTEILTVRKYVTQWCGGHSQGKLNALKELKERFHTEEAGIHVVNATACGAECRGKFRESSHGVRLRGQSYTTDIFLSYTQSMIW